MADPFSPDSLRVPPEMGVYAKKSRFIRRPVRVFDEPFVSSLPLRWVSAAARLPGKSLQVALVVWYQTTIEKNVTIKLSSKTLEMFGVTDGGTKRRALESLENGGLIKVEQKNGKLPLVTILEESSTV
jgi:hypothetical protein